MSYGGLLNLMCAITRPTQSASSTDGGISWVYSVVALEVPCAVQLTGARQQKFASRETGITDGSAYFEFGTDIRVQDLISVLYDAFGAVGGPGFAFEVVGPPVDDAGRGTYARVPIRKTYGGGGE